MLQLLNKMKDWTSMDTYVHEPGRFDIRRLPPDQRATCNFLYAERFAGYSTVAFTWTLKQNLGGNSPQTVLRQGNACLNRVARQYLRSRALDRRRDILWAERGELDGLHMHGLAAVPQGLSAEEYKCALRQGWARNQRALPNSHFWYPETESQTKRWIGYMFKDGYDPDPSLVKL